MVTPIKKSTKKEEMKEANLNESAQKTNLALSKSMENSYNLSKKSSSTAQLPLPSSRGLNRSQLSTLPADLANKTTDNQKPDNSFKKRSALRRKGSGDALKPKREQEFKSIEKHKQTDQSKSASPFETKFKSRTAYSNPYLNLGKKAGSGLKKTKTSTPIEPDSIDFAGALE